MKEFDKASYRDRIWLETRTDRDHSRRQLPSKTNFSTGIPTSAAKNEIRNTYISSKWYVF